MATNGYTVDPDTGFTYGPVDDLSNSDYFGAREDINLTAPSTYSSSVSQGDADLIYGGTDTTPSQTSAETSGNLDADYVVDDRGRVVDSAGNVVSGPTNASTGTTSGGFDFSKFGSSLKNQLSKVLTGAQDNPLGGIAGLLLLSQLLNKKSRTPTIGGYRGPGINMGMTATRQALPQPEYKPYSGQGATGRQFFSPVQYAAQGGIMAASGRYLKGSTDGMADKIPSSIDGKQPAKLSHGEFVIPADVVSHLGNGNSDAGADVLYKMMDRVRRARTGNPHQGKRINPEKFTPGGIASYNGGGAIALNQGGGVAHFDGLGGSQVGPAVTTQNPGGTTTEQNLASWAGPYVMDYLSRGRALAQMPYQPYQGQLTAGTSPLQQQAFGALSSLMGGGYGGGIGGGYGQPQMRAMQQPMRDGFSDGTGGGFSTDPRMQMLGEPAVTGPLSSAGRMGQGLGGIGGIGAKPMDAEGQYRQDLLMMQQQQQQQQDQELYNKWQQSRSERTGNGIISMDVKPGDMSFDRYRAMQTGRTEPFLRGLGGVPSDVSATMGGMGQIPPEFLPKPGQRGDMTNVFAPQGGGMGGGAPAYPSQFDTATRFATQAGERAGQMQYTPGQFTMGQVTAPELKDLQMQGPEAVTGAQTQAAQLGATPQVQAAQMQGPQPISMERVQAGQVTAPQLQQYQMAAQPQVTTQSFAQPGSAESYMSPYMQNVVSRQQQAAQREADIASQAQKAQFAQAGAFGGGRQGVAQARAAEALARQKGDIQAQGLQSAYQQAQQQFNQEQQARLAAQQANLQAGLTTGQQNLAAQLGVQQLGAQTGLQAQQLNQATGLQAALANQQAGLQSGQFNAQQAYNTALQNAQLQQQANLANQGLLGQYGLQQGQFGQQAAMQNAQLAQQAALANQQMGYNTGLQNLQARLATQQLGAGQNLQSQLANQQALMQAQQAAEQSRQFGAGYGMQGVGQQLAAAGQLGNLGQGQFGTQMQGIQALLGAGATQYGQEQANLTALQNEYNKQMMWPYQQLQFQQSMMAGLPISAASNVQNLSPLQNFGQILGQVGGIPKLFGG